MKTPLLHVSCSTCLPVRTPLAVISAASFVLIGRRAMPGGSQMISPLHRSRHPAIKRAAGISIKSDEQLTNKRFPADFVQAMWRQWLKSGRSAIRPRSGRRCSCRGLS